LIEEIRASDGELRAFLATEMKGLLAMAIFWRHCQGSFPVMLQVRRAYPNSCAECVRS
jgi:hypothetical protein